MKIGGVKRIEKGVIPLIERSISDELKLLIRRFKESLEINGGRILTRKIVRDIFRELKKEEEIEYYEK